MQTDLLAIMKKLEGGNEEALVLNPRTLWLVLNELKNMCKSTDSIECIPVQNGGPGFWMHPRGTTLFYIVQNGELAAGYMAYLSKPDAPGL